MEESEVENLIPIIELRKEDCFNHNGNEYTVLTRYLKKDGCLKAINFLYQEVNFKDPDEIILKY